MNMLFKTRYERKSRRCDKIIHKAMRIPVDIHERNLKICVTVQLKHLCKLKFLDHLWLPFIEQPQSDIVFFAIITFRVYKILVKNENME